MRYWIVSAVLVGMVSISGCSEQAVPTAAQIDSAPRTEAETFSFEAAGKNGGGVVHHVSIGGADICEAVDQPTGCDANFSLTARQKAGGSVKGQWQDTIKGIDGIHVAINSLNVDGNGAVVSGTITKGSYFDAQTGQVVELDGVPAFTAMVDNGTSRNVSPDQISFTWFNSSYGSQGETCEDYAVDDFQASLFNLENGQVSVR